MEESVTSDTLGVTTIHTTLTNHTLCTLTKNMKESNTSVTLGVKCV